MRKIQLRAYNKKEKKMYCPNELFYLWLRLDGTLVEVEEQIGKMIAGVNRGKDFELMQFTGLLDKNGKEIKEIYEGDIVNNGISNYEVKFGKYTLKGSDEDKESGTLHSWDENAYGWYITTSMGDETLEEWMEVVGNVWQNPDLLGGGEPK